MYTKRKVPEAKYSIDFYERSARLVEENFGIDLNPLTPGTGYNRFWE